MNPSARGGTTPFTRAQAIDWPRCSPKCPVLAMKNRAAWFGGGAFSAARRHLLCERRDGIAEMRKRVSRGQEDSGLVCAKGHDGFEIKAGRRSGAEGPSRTVAGAGDRSQDLSDRAQPFSRAPGVVFSGPGFGQAGVPLLLTRDLQQELGAEASCRRNRGRSGGCSGWLILRVWSPSDAWRERCKAKEIKTDTTHFSLVSQTKNFPDSRAKTVQFKKRPVAADVRPEPARLPPSDLIAKWCSTRL